MKKQRKDIGRRFKSFSAPTFSTRKCAPLPRFSLIFITFALIASSRQLLVRAQTNENVKSQQSPEPGTAFTSTSTAPDASSFESQQHQQHEAASPSAPLLSNEQREQLVKIETAILNSPDPKDTLLQVARLNEVHPEQLLTLIEQNRRELDGTLTETAGMKGQHSVGSTGAGAVGGVAGGGGSVASSSQRNVWKLLSSLGIALMHTTAKHPKLVILLTLSILIALALILSAGQTGLVLSSQRGWFSHGPTTLLNPPTTYLQQRMNSPDLSKYGKISVKSKNAWKDILPEVGEEDGSTWLDNLDRLRRREGKPSQIQQAATCQLTVSAREFVLDEDDEALDNVIEVSLDHASDLLSARLLTEFVHPPQSLRLVTRERGGRKHAMLVVNKMGDWNRFGLMPLQVMQVTDDDELSLTLTTHAGGHLDGQIHVSIGKEGAELKIRCYLVVPKKGRRISKRVALRIVEGLSKSMAASIRTRTKQSLARRGQSSRFSMKAKERAGQRRRSRLEQEVALEEMAEDRRRRWQRDNPNAGHYRPSGDRMKSPLNAVY